MCFTKISQYHFPYLFQYGLADDMNIVVRYLKNSIIHLLYKMKERFVILRFVDWERLPKGHFSKLLLLAYSIIDMFFCNINFKYYIAQKKTQFIPIFMTWILPLKTLKKNYPMLFNGLNFTIRKVVIQDNITKI